MGPEMVFFSELDPLVELIVATVSVIRWRSVVTGDAVEVGLGDDVLGLILCTRCTADLLLSSLMCLLRFFLFQDVAEVRRLSFLVMGFDIFAVQSFISTVCLQHYTMSTKPTCNLQIYIHNQKA